MAVAHKSIKELETIAATATDLILLEVLKELRELNQVGSDGNIAEGGAKNPPSPANKKGKKLFGIKL